MPKNILKTKKTNFNEISERETIAQQISAFSNLLESTSIRLCIILVYQKSM